MDSNMIDRFWHEIMDDAMSIPPRAYRCWTQYDDTLLRDMAGIVIGI